MKKTLADQIELKIRQMKDRYKHLKNTSSENILRQTSIPKNPINEIIRQDLKTHLPILKLQSSRDVSHLQKNRSPKTQVSSTAFPTDLLKLRKILEFQGLLNENSSSACVKASSGIHSKKLSDIDEQTIELLEKLDHGVPSSRKEAENLMNWYLEMKSRYETDENFDSVIILCEQELVKHVLVECKTRGNLLKMIFAHYHSLAIKNKEKSDEKINEHQANYQAKAAKYERRIEDLSQKLHTKGVENLNLVKKHEEIVKNLEDDVGFFKKKLQDMQKLYLEEQELWKKQWVSASRRQNNQPMVIYNSSYKLAVTRLRPDLFPNNEPTFPEELKKKIESGEALDVNELQKYRDEMIKFQQEQNSEFEFVDAEVQTEAINLEPCSHSYHSNRSSLANDDYFITFSSAPNQEPTKLPVPSSTSPGPGANPNPNPNHPESQGKSLADKEMQTDLFEELNESELAEMQNLLENELLEDFEEMTEEDNNDESSMRSSQNSWISGIMDRKRQTHSDKFAEFIQKQDPNFDFKSPIYQQGTPTNLKEPAPGLSPGDKTAEARASNEGFSEVSLKMNSQKDPAAKPKPEDSRKNSLHVTFTGNEEEKTRAKSRGDLPADKAEKAEKEKERPDKSGRKAKAHAFTPKPGQVGTPKAMSQATSPTPSALSEGASPKALRSVQPKSLSFTEASEASQAPPAGSRPEILSKVVSAKDLKEKISFALVKSPVPPDQGAKLQKQSTFTKTQNLTQISEDNNGESSDSDRSSEADDSQTIEKSQKASKSQHHIKKRPKGESSAKESLGRAENLQTSDLPSNPKSERNSQRPDSSKDLSRKNSEKHLPRKRDSYIINIKASSERRGSVPLALSGPSMIKEIREAAVPSNIKLSTLSLLKNIQMKKKELADIERQIEEKKRLLNESSSDSSDSESLLMDHISPGKRRMSTTDVLNKVLKRLSLKPDEAPEDKRRKSATQDVIKSMITQELEKRNSVNIMKRRSFNNTPIQEEDEDEDDMAADEKEFEEFDSVVWKNGYNVGFARGRSNGLNKGKTIGREEGMDEGYVKAIKELHNDSLSEDSDKDASRANLNESAASLSHLKYRRGTAGPEFILKSTKELTKFAEFKFTKTKPAVVKPVSPAHEIIKKLLKKSKENMEKSAKASKKMVNKIISNTYSTSWAKSPLESPEELLEICYDEFSQRYGLKKVIDRKFMEFLSSLFKVKSYKRPFMFIKLSGLGRSIKLESYSKFTLGLYLSSLNYMLTSKIGITMNYEETDDKNLFPINRASECLREKLEGILDRVSINSLVYTIESKAMPDPQRISTGLIELEYVLEVICDSYENQQRKIVNGAKTLFRALGYLEGSAVLQYDFCFAVRFICPHKFHRLESEEIVSQEIGFDELIEICIEMNVLSENDLNHFVKSYAKKPFENFDEMIGIVERMEKGKVSYISIDREQWRNRLGKCRSELKGKGFDAVLVWKLYESELKRIECEF